jgi:hypothetical protein
MVPPIVAEMAPPVARRCPMIAMQDDGSKIMNSSVFSLRDRSAELSGEGCIRLISWRCGF